MKFGLTFANVGGFVEPEGAVALGRAAEDAGLDSLWTVEHVVVPKGYESTYPYSPDGRIPGDGAAPLPDPLIWLAYVAAATSTIKLATGIAILPQRNPLITAKEVATLDRLSGGRVILGVGVGWLEEEFDALGVPFERRGERLDDYIELFRKVWTGEEVSHDSDFVRFRDSSIRPTPVQPSVPIHIGGHSGPAARRAGRIGDGFCPGPTDDETLARTLDTMRAAATDAGRDPDDVEVTIITLPDVEAVKRYTEMGVHRIIIPPLAFDAAGIGPALAQFADDVIAKVS